MCESALETNIIKTVNDAKEYSILADETADISGKAQLSIGLRFFHESRFEEVFVRFVELKGLIAIPIAQTIVEFSAKEELYPNKCGVLRFEDFPRRSEMSVV